MTPIQLAHAESCANAIAGLVIAQCVLWAFGVPMREAIALNAAMLGVSYARAFVLRLIFAKLAGPKTVDMDASELHERAYNAGYNDALLGGR